MKFKVNGVELAAPESFRIREVCEAEKSLGLSLNQEGLAATLAIALFIALRRKDPERDAVAIADEVMGIDMAELEEIPDDPHEEGEPATPPRRRRPRRSEPADYWTPALGSVGVTVPIADLTFQQLREIYKALDDG